MFLQKTPKLFTQTASLPCPLRGASAGAGPSGRPAGGTAETCAADGAGGGAAAGDAPAGDAHAGVVTAGQLFEVLFRVNSSK